MYNYDIENWWRHNGLYDRQQASGIRFDGNSPDAIQEYFDYTDEWWNSLSNVEKTQIYDEFFSEY